MKQLLVRADDLGYSEGVNYGIAKSVNEGIIRTVGIMTNMPSAAHGLNLLSKKSLCLGQHTNICVGRPIVDSKQIPSLCQDNGEFKNSRSYRNSAKNGEDFVVLDEVILEIEAQYQRFKELTGQEPDYFEGHAVASDNFFKGLEIVAKRHGLPYLPMGKPNESVLFRNTKIYPYIPKDFESYEKDPFLAIKDAVENAHEDGCDMIVFHPGYLDAYLIRTSSMTTTRVMEAEMLSRPEINEWLNAHEVCLVTYDDLR